MLVVVVVVEVAAAVLVPVFAAAAAVEAGSRTLFAITVSVIAINMECCVTAKHAAFASLGDKATVS